jgi:hypothetical protein
MEPATVRYRVDDHVARIVMNRTHRRREPAGALNALGRLEGDPYRS